LLFIISFNYHSLFRRAEYNTLGQQTNQWSSVIWFDLSNPENPTGMGTLTHQYGTDSFKGTGNLNKTSEGGITNYDAIGTVNYTPQNLPQTFYSKFSYKVRTDFKTFTASLTINETNMTGLTGLIKFNTSGTVNSDGSLSAQISAVPEPSTILGAITAAVCGGLIKRKRKR
jgi:hypothetical protein